ncbi:MAG: hypothetical protein ACLQUZ_06365 [Rhizomicrobium sp.]
MLFVDWVQSIDIHLRSPLHSTIESCLHEAGWSPVGPDFTADREAAGDARDLCREVVGMNVMSRMRAQNLKCCFFLLRVTHIHPKQKSAARELLLDACRVVFMHYSAEGCADKSAGAHRDQGGQNRSDPGKYDGADRGQGWSRQIFRFEPGDTRKKCFSRHIRTIFYLLHLLIAVAKFLFNRFLAGQQRKCGTVKATRLKSVDSIFERLGVVEYSDDFPDSV